MIKPTKDVWLKNFRNSVSELLKENKAAFYTSKSVVMTEFIYRKYCHAVGSKTTDILGYKIEVLEQTQEQFEEEGDIIFISGEALN